jgi:hypothetical protein
MEIRPVGATLIHADIQTCGRRTGMRNVIRAYRNCANTPENKYFSVHKSVLPFPLRIGFI